MSSVSIDGIAIGFDDEGSGEPVVLVHGHPFDRSMWRPQIEHFSRSGWRVIAPDLRGYGESTLVPGKTTLETFAGDIAALLDRLGVDGVVLGGISMGGQIVMEFHRLFPNGSGRSSSRTPRRRRRPRRASGSATTPRTGCSEREWVPSPRKSSRR